MAPWKCCGSEPVAPMCLTEHPANSGTPPQVDHIMNALNIPREQKSQLCQVKPTTRSGRLFKTFPIVGIAIIPTIALLALVAHIFVGELESALMLRGVNNTLSFGLEISNMINVLQGERDKSALYASAIGPETKKFLLRSYILTDEAIKGLRDWPRHMGRAKEEYQSSNAFMHYLNVHRYNLDLVEPLARRELTFYSDIMSHFMSWFYDAITEARSGTVWKELMAVQETMVARESCGMERALGAIFYIRGGFGNWDAYLQYTENQDAGVASLRSARQISFSFEKMLNDTFLPIQDTMDELSDMRAAIRSSLLKPSEPSLEKANIFFDDMTLYLKGLFAMQQRMTDAVIQSQDKFMTQKSRTISIFACVFGFVVLLAPLIIYAVYAVISEIHAYFARLADRTKALDNEKKRADALLYQMLPKTVAENLKRGEVVNAESFSSATIFSSDIVSFTTISSRSSPIQVVNMLNCIYLCFDEQIQRYDVYKIETIGDAYIVASGLPHRNGNRHVTEIASMSLDLLRRIWDVTILHMPKRHLRVRIGLHTGPVAAGVVGRKMPRYCLFGETVRMAALMEATGQAGRIHVSEAMAEALTEQGGFELRPRSNRIQDSSGERRTFWLQYREDPPTDLNSSDSDWIHDDERNLGETP